MWVANLSVFQTMTAHETKHAFRINVKTLAQEYAELMPTAEPLIITQRVLAMMAIREIRFLHAVKSQKHPVRNLFIKYAQRATYYFFHSLRANKPLHTIPMWS